MDGGENVARRVPPIIVFGAHGRGSRRHLYGHRCAAPGSAAERRFHLAEIGAGAVGVAIHQPLQVNESLCPRGSGSGSGSGGSSSKASLSKPLPLLSFFSISNKDGR